MRFIRKHGRVIPIRDERQINKKAAAAVGATVGAGYHIHKGDQARKLEKAAQNHRSLKKFIAKLQPGDIVVEGTNAKNSGGFLAGNIFPKPVMKHLRKFGIRHNTAVTNTTKILTGVGAGEKYHASIYVGGGKISHAFPREGVVVDKLGDIAWGQNLTALRFKNAGEKEKKEAVNFALKAAKKGVKYNKHWGVESAISNLVAPVGKKPTQSFGEMVCHTLPVRAWHKRPFALGEHTYAGDLIKTPGITAVARRDVVKGIPTVRAFAGNAAKGLKWGIGAAIGAAAINYALKKRKKK